jgi:hypothetical protein
MIRLTEKLKIGIRLPILRINRLLEISPTVNDPAQHADAKKAINASKSTTEPTGSDAGSSAMDLQEIKLPSYMLKKSLNSATTTYTHVTDASAQYMQFVSPLDGDIQQKLDLDFIESKFKVEIQKGEVLLTNFAQQLWATIVVCHQY